MTDREVQELFLRHPFSEAKKMLIEECQRNGHELLGHENVFELKALATQGARGILNQGGAQQFVSGNGSEPGGTQGGNGGVPGAGASSGEPQNGNAGGEPTQGEPQMPGGNGEGGEGGEGGQSQEEGGEVSQSQSPEQSPDQNGEPKKKRRRRSSKQPEQNEPQLPIDQQNPEQQQGSEPQQPQEPQKPTPDQKEEEARKKMEEAKKLLEEAEKEREEQRKREEEERLKRQQQQMKSNRHKDLDEIIRRLKCLGKAFLVGPAGTGKSTLAMLACRELFGIEGGIDEVMKSGKFAQISFSPDTVTADMLGFTDVNGVFHETEIVRVFRDGGLILFDEMDDADASLLVKLNTMLSNRVVPTPNGVITQHPQAYIVGTANTYGTGGNSMYVGRSRLDAATLDRWKMSTVTVDYDTRLERGICIAEFGEDKDAQKKTDEIMSVAKSLRESIGANKWKQICSTRFVTDAAKMMKAGYHINQCIDTFLMSWDDNSRRIAKSNCKDALKNNITLE